MASQKVFTNTSGNPVVLSDGSSVQPGEQTTEAQFELAKASLWAEHGILVPGAPEAADADADLQVLITENDQLKQDLFATQAKLTDLEAATKGHPEQLKDLQDKLTQEQARSSKLETELKAAQDKLKK